MNEPAPLAESAKPRRKGPTKGIYLLPNLFTTGTLFGAFYANGEWAAKNAAAVKAWVDVTLKTAAFTNTHHKETEQLMADMTKTSAVATRV